MSYAQRILSIISSGRALRGAPEQQGAEASATDFPGIAVSLRDLEKRFGDFTAVDRISLEVRKGEIFGFLGPNGAGKSTTIRMLCGIITPTGGSGSVAGFDIVREPEAIKRNIGYMSQKFSLYEELTVEENIDFYGGIYRIPAQKREARKEWVLAMAGLTHRRSSKSGTLSGGLKQRLALGCAILHEPPVIFLDEPTSGVDPVSRRNFWELIHLLAGEGVTVFVTTHYLDEAEYCDRLALIYRGEINAMGTPEELKSGAMTESVIEVVCDRPQELLERIELLEGVRSAALFGRGVHIIADGATTLRGIDDLLAENGRNSPPAEIVTPSLEELFVSLIEARDRQEQR